jgi:hypothetical protein
MFIELMRYLLVAAWRHSAGVAGTGSRFCERKCGEGMMKGAELLKEGCKAWGKATLY